jgi:hypothetical protein
MLTLGALAYNAVPALAQGRIDGTVFDSLATKAPLRGAMVVLVERGRYATSNERGRFVFDSVPEGQYTVGFLHPVLDSLDMYLAPVRVDMPHSGRATVALAVPSPATIYAALCPGQRDAETGVLIGRVRDVEAGTPVPDAMVGTSWTEYVLSAAGREDRRFGLTAKSDQLGAFRLCGVPLQLLLDVRAYAAGITAGPLRLVVDDRLLGHANIAVSLRDSAPRDTVSATSTETATLRGTVRDRSGRAVRDAIVGVLDDPRTVRTDATGGFRLDGVPAGSRTLEARTIGASPATLTVDVTPRQEHVVELTISKSAQALSPVIIVGRSAARSMMERSGFSDRRRRGFGDLLSADEIAELHAFDLGDTLLRIRGVTSTWIGGERMPTLRGRAGERCVPNFFLDGVPFQVERPRPGEKPPYPFGDLSSLVPADAIRGIEVYSANTVPPEFDRSAFTGCGSIVIWTR